MVVELEWFVDLQKLPYSSEHIADDIVKYISNVYLQCSDIISVVLQLIYWTIPTNV